MRIWKRSPINARLGATVIAMYCNTWCAKNNAGLAASKKRNCTPWRRTEISQETFIYLFIYFFIYFALQDESKCSVQQRSRKSRPSLTATPQSQAMASVSGQSRFGLWLMCAHCVWSSEFYWASTQFLTAETQGCYTQDAPCNPIGR